VKDTLVHLRVADDSSFADITWPCLELGLDERDDKRLWLHQALHSR
jgi:hypothetical protein